MRPSAYWPLTAGVRLGGTTARRPLLDRAALRRVRESVGFVSIALLTALAVLALLDWALFDTPFVAPHLPVNDAGSPANKLLLTSRYPESEVLYLGDSRVHYGINPSVVSNACDCGPGFNAGFAAADPRLTRIMAEKLLRRLSPRLVVIGVSQWELSDAADIRVWGPAPELVPPWQFREFDVTVDQPRDVRALLISVWRLYRYRNALRGAIIPSEDSAGRDDEHRGFDNYRERQRLRDGDLDERQEQWFSDFSVQGRRADALRGLLADLRERGIPVVLVAPPLYPGFHDRVRREVAEFRAAVGELASEGGAVFEDLSTPRRARIESDHFVDAVHLDEDGATRLSRHLGRVIRSRLAAD